MKEINFIFGKVWLFSMQWAEKPVVPSPLVINLKCSVLNSIFSQNCSVYIWASHYTRSPHTISESSRKYFLVLYLFLLEVLLPTVRVSERTRKDLKRRIESGWDVTWKTTHQAALNTPPHVRPIPVILKITHPINRTDGGKEKAFAAEMA